MVQPIQNVISFTKRRQHGDKANKLRRGKTELHANSFSDETLPLKINFMKSDGIRKAYVIKNYYQPKIFSIRQNARKHQPVTSDEWKLKILVYQLFTTGREVLLVSISSDIAET
ncbi:hypothetical protein T06_8432 [Trichinella sp. T6]|nr:hypothetical protein T06_8432 [Trichinella sp. T6]